jgi:hypothetical protein
MRSSGLCPDWSRPGYAPRGRAAPVPSQPASVVGVAARLSGRLEEQRSLRADGGRVNARERPRGWRRSDDTKLSDIDARRWRIAWHGCTPRQRSRPGDQLPSKTKFGPLVPSTAAVPARSRGHSGRGPTTDFPAVHNGRAICSAHLNCRSIEDFAVLLTLQNKGSGACTMPLTFLRPA